MENTQPKQLRGWRLALDRAPQFISVLLLCILPFVTQLKGMNPILPKQVLLQTLVFLMLGLWALKVYLEGRLIWVSSKALMALGLLAAWILLTWFFSDYSPAVLVGLREYAPLFCWYLLLTLTCVELWRAENLLIVVMVSGLGSSLWAIGQFLGVDGSPWQDIVRNQFGGRVTAGFGNPDFLAGHLLLIWPMAAGLLARAQNLFSKSFWGLVVVSSLLALVLTGSKAGWAGLFAGMVVFAFVMTGEGVKKALPWILALAVLLSFSALISPMSDRLRGLLEKGNESVVFREQVWKGSLEMIKDHPLIGTGFGTFASSFPSHRPPSMMMKQVQRSYEVDHAHNWVLEWIVETGVIGFGLLSAFCYFILAQWRKLYTARAIPIPLAAGFFAASAGIAVDNLFDINGALPSTLVPLLFLAAFPVALSQRFLRMPGFPIQLKIIDITGFRIYLLPVLALMGAGCLWQLTDAFERQRADVKWKKATAMAESARWEEALALYKEVLLEDPLNYSAQYFRGSVYADRKMEGDLLKAWVDFTEVGLAAPDYLLLHFKKSAVLKVMGQPDEAKVEMKRAIQLDPPLIFQREDFKTARKMILEKHYQGALDIYQNLVLDYPACVPLLVDYGNCLVLMKKESSAVRVYQEALAIDPGNREAAANLKSLSTQ